MRFIHNTIYLIFFEIKHMICLSRDIRIMETSFLKGVKIIIIRTERNYNNVHPPLLILYLNVVNIRKCTGMGLPLIIMIHISTGFVFIRLWRRRENYLAWLWEVQYEEWDLRRFNLYCLTLRCQLCIVRTIFSRHFYIIIPS